VGGWGVVLGGGGGGGGGVGGGGPGWWGPSININIGRRYPY
jgi:hypothetical protein